ncbi:dipeptidase [Aliikangiella coralliicola]|uniref:Membrane dipeptidase n=1 Tax=Aliikangiella coralliicola TaxID=2592383 RepID=A0A545UBP6_9GAMM|nr:dipeptidase [Aliikangiella coralliicola]TQV86891.1 membrane dipeptidase [Aliikangiella coralliicola]
MLLSQLKPLVFKTSQFDSKSSRRVVKPILSLVALIGLAGCQEQKEASVAEDKLKAKPTQVLSEQVKTKKLTASEIAKKYIIADTHIDVPYRLEEKFEDISQATEGGDFDYQRAVAGGLDAPFMSIYIPASLQETGGSKELADKLIDMVEGIVKKAPQKYALAYSTAEVESNFEKGIISLPMGLENGSPIEGKLENLQHFYQRGIRYITLAHSKANHISDSSYDESRPAKGLTEFGKKLVTAMNNTGVMIDVSHISDEAFYQVMEISKVPVIASHSSARHFTPGFERNMSDDMIRLLAKNGGVIQINFGSTFISKPALEHWNVFKAAREDFMKKNKVEQSSEQVKKFTSDYLAEKPFPYAGLSDVLDHFDHVVKLVGIDYVGVGSDYDGVGDSLPVDLKDVSSYPNLIQGLMDRGYSEADIAKILSGNLMRVWKQVEDYAEKQK